MKKQDYQKYIERLQTGNKQLQKKLRKSEEKNNLHELQLQNLMHSFNRYIEDLLISISVLNFDNADKDYLLIVSLIDNIRNQQKEKIEVVKN